jgi:starch-binding outer membrane protein, SusD/RagB family
LNAEVYTGQAKYTECIDSCKKIIGGGYSLADNTFCIFSLTSIYFSIQIDFC